MPGPNGADRLARRILTLVEARSIAYADPKCAVELLAGELDEEDLTYELNARLAEGGLDERVDLFLPYDGVAVLLDAGGEAPAIDRLRRCSRHSGVLAITVLTTLSPDVYPAGHSQRHVVSGKSLSVIRIGRGHN